MFISYRLLNNLELDYIRCSTFESLFFNIASYNNIKSLKCKSILITFFIFKVNLIK